MICDSEMSAEARGAALGEQCTILLSRPADFETTLVRRVLRDLPPKAPRRLQQVLELLLDCERAIRRSSRADGESAPQAAPPPRLLDRNAKLLLALRTLQRNALRAAPSLELRHLVSLGCEEGKTPHAPYKPPHPTHLTLSLTRRSHPLLLVHSPRPHPSEGLALALTLTIPAPSPSLPLYPATTTTAPSSKLPPLSLPTPPKVAGGFVKLTLHIPPSAPSAWADAATHDTAPRLSLLAPELAACVAAATTTAAAAAAAAELYSASRVWLEHLRVGCAALAAAVDGATPAEADAASASLDARSRRLHRFASFTHPTFSSKRAHAPPFASNRGDGDTS